MENSIKQSTQSSHRRQRLHEILIALIKQQGDLELMDHEAPKATLGNSSTNDIDPGRWLERNRRVLRKYQALVRTAITLDALLDAEETT